MEESDALLNISELSKQGYAELKKNNVDEAETIFEKILSADEKNHYALVGMGDAERKAKRIKEAVVWYQKCLEHHPGNHYALFGLADCYKELSDYKHAIDVWQAYLVHDMNNISVLTRVADAYRKVRDFKNSKQMYLRVLEMEKTNSYALIGLGHLHYDFHEYKDALFYWTKIYTSDNSAVDIRILTSIGNCHRKLKNFSEGISYFQSALEIDDDNFYALFGIADCYRGMHMPHMSLQYWAKILKKDPENKAILTRMGDAYRALGNYGKAKECYEEALDIHYDMYAELGLALLLKGEGEYGKAALCLKRLLSEDENNVRFRVEAAECMTLAGDKEGAKRVLEDFLRRNSENAVIRDMLYALRS